MGSYNQEIITERNSISNEELLSWGLLGKVNRERIIDKNIKDIRTPNKKEFNNFQDKWKKLMMIDNKEQLEIWLKINGLTLDSLNSFLKRKWKFFKWSEYRFKDILDSYFLEKKENFDKVTFLIIRVSSKDLANELYLRIKEDEETFENIAFNYSEGHEKDRNGLAGPVLIKNIHPVIKEILLASKLKELNQPIKIDNKYIILKLLKRDIAILNEEIRDSLLEELREKFLYEELRDNA